MSRADFSPWGTELSAEEFAQALAAHGVLTATGWFPSQDDDLVNVALQVQRRLLDQGAEPVEWGMPSWSSWPDPATLPPARLVADGWRRAVQSVQFDVRPRLEVVRPPPGLDVQWVSDQLLMPGVTARSVYVADEWLSADAEWNWPLRVGLLMDDTSYRLQEELEQDHWHNELFDLVPGAEDADELDLLLAQIDAGEALRAVLEARTPVKANCVVLFRRRNDTWQAARPLLEALGTGTGASGVVVAPMAMRYRALWFHELIRALSHDEPLDVALLEASREAKARPPLLLANRALARVSRVSVAAERIAGYVAGAGGLLEIPESLAEDLDMASGPSPAAAVATQFQARIRYLLYDSESGGATEVADLARAAESILGPARDRDFRRLLAHVYDVSDPARPQKLEAAFRSGAPHNVDVWIGPWEAGTIAAGTPFPEDLLPPSAGGHWLTVVLTEPRSSPETQVRRLRLPSVGPSRKCQFVLHPPQEAQDVEARISVLYRNRILQTALLRGPVVSDPAHAPSNARISFETGAIIRPSIGDLTGRQPFDAALVFNTLLDSTPAVTEVAGLHADFRVLEGIDEQARLMQQELTEAAKSPDRYDAFDTPASLILLRTLANQGAALREALIGQLAVGDAPNGQQAIGEASDGLSAVGEALTRARRIQILSAKPEQVVPVELIYDRPAPSETARLCPNFYARVEGGECDDDCPGGDEVPSSYVCPLAFWCANRIIERQAGDEKNRLPDPQLDLRFTTEPTKGRDVLAGFTTALFAGSTKVDSLAATPGDSRLARILRTLVEVTDNHADGVTTWSAWKKKISDTHPSLLLLLPHTLPVLGVQGMEIGTSARLAWTHLTRDMIRTPSGAPPIVLLLGCDTAMPEIAFQNFVLKFRQPGGAAIVLGTFAAILGRYAAPLAEDLVVALRQATLAATPPGVDSDEATFGKVLWSARRRLMANGQLMALTLIAYGDAQWRLGPPILIASTDEDSNGGVQ
jgi:hypothetical protein